MTMYKMKFNHIDLRFNDFFLESKYKKTRGNAFKLVIPTTKTKIRQNFFSCSTVKHWNALKSSDINIQNPLLFKKKILSYFSRQKMS